MMKAMTYLAADDRYDQMPYRRTGRWGLKLPAVSLGLWHNFGDDKPLETQRAILRRAFDLGVTHFDLANNYGPPYGSAETNFGRHMRDDFAPLPRRADHLQQGRLGHVGRARTASAARASTCMASLDQSLQRMGLDYVDIFYSHRFDPDTPIDETMGALDAIVRQGKALYVGISSYSAERTERGDRDPARAGARRCSSTSRTTRCSTAGSSPTCSTSSASTASAASPSRRSPRGCSPTATSTGIPEDSRAAQGKSLDERTCSTTRTSSASAR